MEHQHASDLVKRLEQLGIEVDVSPAGTSLTYEQIYFIADVQFLAVVDQPKVNTKPSMSASRNSISKCRSAMCPGCRIS